MENDEKQREYGFYWVKRAGEDDWEIARYYNSWGINGWWACGEEYAFYDDRGQIDDVGEMVTRANKH